MRSMRRDLGVSLLWQLPGWVGLAVVLGWLTAWLGLPWWGAPLGVGLLALKDLALFPAIRQTFRPSRLRGPGPPRRLPRPARSWRRHCSAGPSGRPGAWRRPARSTPASAAERPRCPWP